MLKHDNIFCIQYVYMACGPGVRVYKTTEPHEYGGSIANYPDLSDIQYFSLP